MPQFALQDYAQPVSYFSMSNHWTLKASMYSEQHSDSLRHHKKKSYGGLLFILFTAANFRDSD